MIEKINKRVKGRVLMPAVFGFGVLLALVVMGGVGQGADSKTEDRLTVKAWIDDECRSHPAEFTIPAGKTGKDFISGGLQAGKACHEGGAPENKGFAIRDSKNRPIYMWSQYKDQKPYEKGGPLSALTLDPGDYTLSVAGGAGAGVELSYLLK